MLHALTMCVQVIAERWGSTAELTKAITDAKAAGHGEYHLFVCPPAWWCCLLNICCLMAGNCETNCIGRGFLNVCAFIGIIAAS